MVIKVPHTGPVNAQNVDELLNGDKRLSAAYDNPSTKDAFRGHNLALMLKEHGYRVNFTLMFEPYQTALALQARPYFINSFIRHRKNQTDQMKQYLEFYKLTNNIKYLEDLRTFMVANDYFCVGQENTELIKVMSKAMTILDQRKAYKEDEADGLDGFRQNLRLLRQTNMEDTRLIICSMDGDYNYYDIDNVLSSPEYSDMAGRVVLTTEPSYLARFTSTNQIVNYQRRFMNAANGAK